MLSFKLGLCILVCHQLMLNVVFGVPLKYQSQQLESSIADDWFFVSTDPSSAADFSASTDEDPIESATPLVSSSLSTASVASSSEAKSIIASSSEIESSIVPTPSSSMIRLKETVSPVILPIKIDFESDSSSVRVSSVHSSDCPCSSYSAETSLLPEISVLKSSTNSPSVVPPGTVSVQSSDVSSIFPSETSTSQVMVTTLSSEISSLQSSILPSAFDE